MKMIFFFYREFNSFLKEFLKLQRDKLELLIQNLKKMTFKDSTYSDPKIFGKQL